MLYIPGTYLIQRMRLCPSTSFVLVVGEASYNRHRSRRRGALIRLQSMAAGENASLFVLVCTQLCFIVLHDTRYLVVPA